MRHQKVALPRRAFSDRGTISHMGELVIREASDQDRRRSVLVTRVLAPGDKHIKAKLIEPRIVDERLARGIDLRRARREWDGQPVEYARCWHCTIERGGGLPNGDEPPGYTQRSNGLVS